VNQKKPDDEESLRLERETIADLTPDDETSDDLKGGNISARGCASAHCGVSDAAVKHDVKVLAP
jgi:hypothetical protein